MWDVVVVGAGPSGSAAAIGALAAAPDARVLLLDRSDFPRDKSCGDGIAPHALDLLASLEIGGVADGYRPVDRMRLGFASGPTVHRRVGRANYVIPRQEFDARLVRAAVDRGATLRRHRVRTLEQRGDRVVLDGDLAARTVVAADGAHSALRRAIGVPPTRPGHVAVAIRGYAPVRPDLADRQEIVFADQGWPAYAWSFPVGDGSANVGYGEVLAADGRALSRAHMMERLEALLPGVCDGGGRWAAHHLPLSSGRPRQPDGRVLLAGDALSLINPMTGEGIYYAVLSGILAGATAAAGEAATTAGARYRSRLRRELGRHLRHTTVATRLARHRPLVEAEVRAARRSSGVFDDLVELGLGRGLLTRRTLAGLAGGVVRR